MREDLLTEEVFGRKELLRAQKDRTHLKAKVSLEATRDKLDALFRRVFRRNRRESPSRIDLTEEFELKDNEFELLRTEIESPQDHERFTGLIFKTVQNIQEKLPWIAAYPISIQRLFRAKSRFIAIDSKTMNLLDHAYLNSPLITEFREGRWDVSDAKSLAYYNPYGDFIVIPTNMDESIQGSYNLVLTEEVLHSIKPFPPDTKRNLEGSWEFVNEGATRYYLTKVHGVENLHPRLTKPSSFMANTLIGEQLWRVWVEKYGEKRMTDTYFGRQPFPNEINIDLLGKGAVAYLIDIEKREDLFKQIVDLPK